MDDEHADSLRKHPVPITPRSPKLASASGGGNSDFFEEEAAMMAEEEAEKDESLSGASGHDPHNRSVSRRYLPGDEEGTTRTMLHSSLGWELAHLLHVCLGRYIKPEGPSPGVS